MSSTVKHGVNRLIGCRASSPIVILSDSDSECSATESHHTLSKSKTRLLNKTSVCFDRSVVDDAVGHVGGLEEFGDADWSDSADDDDEKITYVTKCNTLSCNKRDDEGCHGGTLGEVHAEKTAFTKLLQPYNVGFLLLPELLREDVFDIIGDGYYAIGNDGYTAQDALLYLHEKVGKLHSNAELRKIFLKGTLSEDLDG